MQVTHQKRRENCIMRDISINHTNITKISYHFISTLLNANFDFDVSVANDVAIDVCTSGQGDTVISMPGNATFNQRK